MAERTTNMDLVERIRDSLPPTLEWTEADVALLALAAAQAKDLDALEGRDGLAAVRERRQGRLALVRIVGQLDFPAHARSTVRRARRAAQTRWNGAAS